MKKKLFLLLLIVALAAFVFTGCTPPTPSEGEGEGEGEPEPTFKIEIVGSYMDSTGQHYVKGGKNYDINVTFDAPTENANAYRTVCSGDYSKQGIPVYLGSVEYPIPLHPSADKKVWSGKVKFPCEDSCAICVEESGCCISEIRVEYGECDWCYTKLPVIVDCEAPWAQLELCLDGCACDGCELSIRNTVCESCAPDKDFCGDSHHVECPEECKNVYDCSGLKSWELALYTKNPFDECCEIPCLEPIWSANGTSCPIEAKTTCLTQFAGKIAGYHPECKTEIVDVYYPASLPAGCTYTYPDTTPDACWWEYCDEFLYCGDDTCGCCEWKTDTKEVITCVDVPYYECNWLWLVLTMEDNVGNKAIYGALIATSEYPDCDNLCIVEILNDKCYDYACNVFTMAEDWCDCKNYDCNCSPLSF